MKTLEHGEHWAVENHPNHLSPPTHQRLGIPWQSWMCHPASSGAHRFVTSAKGIPSRRRAWNSHRTTTLLIFHCCCCCLSMLLLWFCHHQTTRWFSPWEVEMIGMSLGWHHCSSAARDDQNYAEAKIITIWSDLSKSEPLWLFFDRLENNT